MSIQRLSLVLLISALGLLPEIASGQSATDPNQVIAPEWLKGMSYRNPGPTRGGRATAISGVRQSPFTFYLGATGGGVWRTEDAGQTWNNLSDGQIPAGSIGAITVAPSDPNVIYVGTGSACPRGNVSPGIGLFRSTDNGKTWAAAGLPLAGQIGRIEVHPQNPDLAYVAALGNVFGKNKERGVFRTRDGGKSWEHVLAISDSTGVVDIVMDPTNPRILFAAGWRAQRKPWTLIDGGPEGGVWRSMDGGDTWKKLEGGLPTGLLGRIGVAVSPANPQRVWALVVTPEDATAGLYRSEDGGNSWKRICRDHRLLQRGWYYTHIQADPQDENTVYVSNVDLIKSIDGGETFPFDLNPPHGDTHGVWVNPDNPRILINCNDGGACITLNGGETWSTQLNQPTSEFYRVTVSNEFPYRIMGGQQDNSTLSIPSHDPGGVTPFEHWHEVGGAESADIGIDPRDPNVIWATTYSGEITRVDLANGQQRQVTAYPHYTEGTEMRALKYRFQWNAPVLVSKQQPGTVYYGSQYVHRTRNDGQTWEIISPDLTRRIDSYLGIPGGPIQHDATGVEVYCSVFTLEESPFRAGELWAGTDDGRLHLTTDGGQSWQEITPKQLPKECTINKIALSTHAPGRAFIAGYNYRYGDFKPYILRTNDFGKTWTLLTNGSNGIPANHFTRAIGEDPAQQGLLFAGTEFGMYVSVDDGAHWQSLQLNLPHTPITDLEIHEGDLVLSTQGRAFWVLEDIHVLEQLAAKRPKAERRFFTPADTYRTSAAGYSTRFHVYLPEAPAKEDSIRMDIFGPGGQLVRTLSTHPLLARDKISLKAGMNTLSWDLHHQGIPTVEKLVLMEMRAPLPGPWVSPGEYRAVLHIGDWEQSQSLQVLPDPRWPTVKADAYQEQEAFSLEIAGMINDCQEKVRNLRSLRSQLETIANEAERSGHQGPVKALADKLSKQLTAVEDEIVQNKAEASQDNFNYPRQFMNRITRLYSIVIYDHDRPTGGARERFLDLQEVYQGISRRYTEAIQVATGEFNTYLEQNQIPRLLVKP